MQRLDLRHSRIRILSRLAAIQLFAIAAYLGLSVSFQNGMETANHLAGLVGAIGLLAVYLPFSLLLIQKLWNPSYLLASSDGQAEWTPFLATKHLDYPPNTDVHVSRDSVKFLLDSPEATKHLPLSIPIPRTVQRK